MVSLGDPEAIDALARQLDDAAGQLEATYDRLANDVHRVGQDTGHTWSGRRSQNFGIMMVERYNDAKRLSGYYRSAADDLRHIAQDLRQATGTIASVQRRVQSLFHSYHPQSEKPPPWQGTGWNPRNLPPPGDPRWLQVGSTFGIR